MVTGSVWLGGVAPPVVYTNGTVALLALSVQELMVTHEPCCGVTI